MSRRLFLAPPTRSRHFCLENDRGDPRRGKKPKRKKAVQSGQEHRSKLQSIPQRCVQLSKCKCMYRCRVTISDAERNTIFNSFWGTGDASSQRNFIFAHTKRKLKRRGNSDDRTYSYEYELTVAGAKRHVCKEFFLSTLHISDRKVRYVHVKKKHTKDGVISPDRRGKTGPPSNKLKEVVRERIREHIRTLRTLPSHYSRATSKKQFLQPGLNFSLLYLTYVEWCCDVVDDDIQRVAPADRGKQHVYEDVFNNEFNIEFKSPSQDRCDFCDRFDKYSPNEKAEHQTEFDAHQRRKEQARKQKNADKERAKKDPRVAVADFDLEKVLPTPCCKITSVYYKRKLPTYNLTVFDLASKDVVCYMWSGVDAKKGSAESATCLKRWLLHLDDGVEEAIFYSDTAAGQNRNQAVTAMFLHHLANCDGNLSSTTQFFFESGHSQQEADSIHSAIERKSEHEEIFTPKDWVNVVKSIRPMQPVHVVELTFDMIDDYPLLASKFLKNRHRTTTGNMVNWTRIKVIQCRKSCPGSIFVKLEINDANFEEIVVVSFGGNRTSSRRFRRAASVRGAVKCIGGEDKRSPFDPRPRARKEGGAESLLRQAAHVRASWARRAVRL